MSGVRCTQKVSKVQITINSENQDKMSNVILMLWEDVEKFLKRVDMIKFLLQIFNSGHQEHQL